MRSKKLRTALLASAVFTAGWTAGQFIGGTPNTVLTPLIGVAQAQADAPITDPQILALMMGVASVAVDTEAGAIRINGLTDRLAALERRVAKLESPSKR